MSLSLQGFPFRAFPIMSNLTYMSRAWNAAPGSTAWGTINQARYVPMWVPERVTVVKLLAYNGSTALGVTDIGLYDAAGSEVIGSATAAQAGTNNWQEFDVTDTAIHPGLYYIGLLNTLSTATYFSWANKEMGRALGVFSEAVGAGTLPTTATFAALDAAVIPVVGMSTRVTI